MKIVARTEVSYEVHLEQAEPDVGDVFILVNGRNVTRITAGEIGTEPGEIKIRAFYGSSNRGTESGSPGWFVKVK